MDFTMASALSHKIFDTLKVVLLATTSHSLAKLQRGVWFSSSIIQRADAQDLTVVVVWFKP